MNATTIAIGDVLLATGLKFVISTSCLQFICTLLIFHNTIANCISLCFISTKSLKSQPPILKAVTQICLIFFWHWPAIAYYEPWDILQNLVVVSVDIQMCFIFFLLEGAVKGLKKRIKEQYDLMKLSGEGTTQLYRDEPCLNTDEPIEAIYKLRHIQSDIYKAMQLANRCYGVPAFFITLFCRFLFALFLYRWLNQDFVVVDLLRAWISFQRILYICYRLESLKLEETQVAELLNDLDLSPLDSRTKIEFNLFLLQTENFSLTFTSVHLFTLDFSLITTMFTTTMTYLLLLSQLS